MEDSVESQVSIADMPNTIEHMLKSITMNIKTI